MQGSLFQQLIALMNHTNSECKGGWIVLVRLIKLCKNNFKWTLKTYTATAALHSTSIALNLWIGIKVFIKAADKLLALHFYL